MSYVLACSGLEKGLEFELDPLGSFASPRRSVGEEIADDGLGNSEVILVRD